MKFRGTLLMSTVFLSLLAWIGTSNADPIEKALKLIRISSKSAKPISKLRKSSVLRDTNQASEDIAQLNQQEAALILFKRRFTKDSINPVLYHAQALLPNNKESDAQLRLALTAMQYWGTTTINKAGKDKSGEIWKKYDNKYGVTYRNTDTLLYNLTQRYGGRKNRIII